jgi:hypothetical protein
MALIGYAKRLTFAPAAAMDAAVMEDAIASDDMNYPFKV